MSGAGSVADPSLKAAALKTLDTIIWLAPKAIALGSSCHALAQQLGKKTVRTMLDRLCRVVELGGDQEEWIDVLDEVRDLLAIAEYCVRACQPEVLEHSPEFPREHEIAQRLAKVTQAVKDFSWHAHGSNLRCVLESLARKHEDLQRDLANGAHAPRAEPAAAQTPQRYEGTILDVALRRDQLPQDAVKHLMLSTPRADLVVPPEVHATVFQHANSLVPKLAKQLVTEDKPLLAIVGMAGIGKTTLAHAVVDTIKKEFDKVAFLVVGQDQEAAQVLRQAWKELLPDNDPAPPHPAGVIVHELATKLHDQKVLVVFDDVWPSHELHVLNFARLYRHKDHQRGNRVIVTTRDASVLRNSPTGEAWHVEHPPALDSAHARLLLCSHAFNDTDCPPAYKKAVCEVLSRSKGLPLMLQVLGGDLQGQPVETWWVRLKSLGAADLLSGAVDGMRKLVEPSVSALPPLLRRCFMVFAGFPEDNKLDRDYLLGCFQGICPFRFGRSWAEQQLQMLLSKRLISEAFHDESQKFIMHDVLWDVACQQAQQYPGTYLLSQRPSNAQGSSLARIVIQRGKTATLLQAPPAVDDPPLVQSFTCDRPSKLLWSPSDRAASMRELAAPLFGVQHLHIHEDAEAYSFPTLGRFLLLETLHLEGCRTLMRLEHTIAGLGNLCSLTLKTGRASLVTELPTGIGKLSRLTKLQMVRCSVLCKLPETIGNLSQLQHLDLKDLTKTMQLPATIGQLSQLKTLRLTGRGLTELPSTIGKLRSLQHMTLRTWYMTHLPTTIGKLSQLWHLDLTYCTKIPELPASVGQLSRLLHLSLSECYRLAVLPTTIGQLLQLQYLNLNDCWQLGSLPECLTQLTALTEVNVRNCGRLVGAVDLVPHFVRTLRTLPNMKIINGDR